MVHSVPVSLHKQGTHQCSSTQSSLQLQPIWLHGCCGQQDQKTGETPLYAVVVYHKLCALSLLQRANHFVLHQPCQACSNVRQLACASAVNLHANSLKPVCT